MDAISSLGQSVMGGLGKLGGIMGKGPGTEGSPSGLGQAGNWLNLGSGVLGTLRNIFGQRSQDELLKNMGGYTKEMTQLAQNPALLAQRARSLQQPLSQGLVSGVANQVQAQLAERGLSSSPQISQQVYAQALAPYEQHAQDVALATLMQQLGMPITAASSAMGKFTPTDTTAFWKMFLPQPSTTPGSTPGLGAGAAGGVPTYPEGLNPYGGMPSGTWPDTSGWDWPTTPPSFGGSPPPSTGGGMGG